MSHPTPRYSCLTVDGHGIEVGLDKMNVNAFWLYCFAVMVPKQKACLYSSYRAFYQDLMLSHRKCNFASCSSARISIEKLLPLDQKVMPFNVKRLECL